MVTIIFESLDMCLCHIWLSKFMLGIVGRKLVNGANVHALSITFVFMLHFSNVKVIHE